MSERRAGRDARWKPATARPTWRAPVEGPTAERLRRLLYVLPLAARRGDATLEALAAEVGVDASTIEADLREVAERSDYLPADAGADLQIILGGGRVYVWTKGEFSRPVRLSMREALAVALGLRLAALAPTAQDHHSREAFRRRLETRLARAPSDELLEAFAAPDLEPDPKAVRETISTGARDKRPCVILHLKRGSREPEERRIHPYALVHAEGSWYALAHCEKAGAIRRFRVDRTLSARLSDGEFRDQPGFNAEDHFRDGRAFDPEWHELAVVRYLPPMARLVAESEEGDWRDGCFVVRHRVADAGWLVRRVLEFAGMAEVISPEGLRTAVTEAAEAFLADDRRSTG